MIEVVYAGEAAPETYSKSIFLVGPTPRHNKVPSWRPNMIAVLERFGYNGVVFSPEPRDGVWNTTYDGQVEWEKKHLEMADVILAWVPRDLHDMPAFTTNVEFGRYINSGKLLYGRPATAPKNSYLDWMYQDLVREKPSDAVEDLVTQVILKLGEGAQRTKGEREIPLHVWRTPMFQSWYSSQKTQGNRLDAARVLWNFYVKKKLFSYAIWVDIWICAENRNKNNEFVLSRSDISVVVPYCRAADILDSRVVLVSEYRSSVRNPNGYVLELPGGSSFKDGTDPLELASHELEEETGLKIDSDRFFPVQNRQMCATFSSHHANVFAVQLTEEEMDAIEVGNQISGPNQSFGVAEDSERTFVKIKTVRDLILTNAMDWNMLGMVMASLHCQVASQ